MAHPVLDRLMDFCLRFAHSMLAKNGAFHPFAAKLNTAGELSPVAIPLGEEVPPSQALVSRYTALLKDLAAAGEIQAAALCYDTTLATGHAITVSLEHADGESVTVFQPYQQASNGKFRFDPPVATVSPRKFFPQG